MGESCYHCSILRAVARLGLTEMEPLMETERAKGRAMDWVRHLLVLLSALALALFAAYLVEM